MSNLQPRLRSTVLALSRRATLAKVGRPQPPPNAPGLDLLGYGYDVAQRFAREDSVRSQMLDLGRETRAVAVREKTYVVPNTVDFRGESGEHLETVAGKTANEYLSKLNIKAGLSTSFLGFGAEISTNYESTTSKSWEYEFSSVTLAIGRFALGLTVPVAQLRGLLTQQACDAIDHWDPRKVIAEYGTHVLRRVHLGGCISVFYTTQTSKYKSKTSLEIAAKASFSSFFKGTWSSLQEQEVTNFNNASDMRIEIVGGVPDHVAEVRDGNYPPWAATIEVDPDLYNLDPNSLFPIWEFASSDLRKHELRAAVEAYLPALVAETPLLLPPGMVLGLRHSVNQGRNFEPPWKAMPLQRWKGGDQGGASGEGFSWWTPASSAPPYVNIDTWRRKLPPGLVFGLKHSLNQQGTPITAFGQDAATGAELPGFERVRAGDLGAPNNQGFCWYEATGEDFTDWALAELLPRGTVVGLKHSINQSARKLRWQGSTYDAATTCGAPPGFGRMNGGDLGGPAGAGFFWYEKLFDPKTMAV